jgi:hypothetical protein
MGQIRRIYRGTCDHCEAERERLTQFVLLHMDGVKRVLLVCRYCYIHLKDRKKFTVQEA